MPSGQRLLCGPCHSVPTKASESQLQGIFSSHPSSPACCVCLKSHLANPPGSTGPILLFTQGRISGKLSLRGYQIDDHSCHSRDPSCGCPCPPPPVFKSWGMRKVWAGEFLFLMTHSGPDEILAGSNFRSGGGCLDVCLHCLHLQPSKPSFLSSQLAPSGWPGTGWQVAAWGGGFSQ